MAYKYNIAYKPFIKDRDLHEKLLFQPSSVFGEYHIFDGNSLLLPRKLQHSNMELISRTKEGGIVKITVCFSRELEATHPDCICYYNIFLRRILKLMNLKQIGRNYYNDANTQKFFFSSYNNETHKVAAVNWDLGPRDTFKRSDSSEVTFVDYYMQQYNQIITDLNQPLSVSQGKWRRGQRNISPEPILLVPELCYLTGLPDDVNQKPQEMGDLSKLMNQIPSQFFQDGVGDGQLQYLLDYEIPQLVSQLNKLQIKLTFIVVKKRINTRFFTKSGQMFKNPPSGTVVDVALTRHEWPAAASPARGPYYDCWGLKGANPAERRLALLLPLPPRTHTATDGDWKVRIQLRGGNSSQESVTFEDVTVNFTSEEWTLLSGFQKKLYRDVMGETFQNIVTIGRLLDNQIVEEECNNYFRNLRNEDMEKCPQYKYWNQHKECFLCTQDANVHIKPCDLKSIENTSRRKLPIGPFSLNMPIRAHSGGKPDEYFELKENLFKCNDTRNHCDGLQSMENRVRTEAGKKPWEHNQCEKSWSGLSERIQLRDKMFASPKNFNASSKHSDVQISQTNHSWCIHSACKQCGEVCSTHTICQQHKIIEMEEKKYVCKQCGKGFITESYCELHESSHTGETAYVCKQCGKGFITQRYCKLHESSHTAEKPYVCKQCGKGFITQSSCKRHERTHTGEKPFVCKQCGKRFSTQSYFKLHERSHTGEKPYVCKQCGKGFITQSYCKLHERSHTAEKPYVCKQCGKGFITQSSCKKHERTHTGEKPFVCKQCGKGFRTQSYCKLHEKFHTGENNYICRYCGKAFITHVNCKLHERSHTGEKPYVCTQCGKGFSTQSYCKSHERTHTGEKPFVCKQCGKGFITQSYCKRHERTHSGENPFV
nr:zinc finger protein 878-like [Cavia porcellus]